MRTFTSAWRASKCRIKVIAFAKNCNNTDVPRNIMRIMKSGITDVRNKMYNRIRWQQISVCEKRQGEAKDFAEGNACLLD